MAPKKPAPKKTSAKVSSTSKQDAAMASRAPTPAPKLTAAQVSGMRYAAQAAAQYATSTPVKTKTTTTPSGNTKPGNVKPDNTTKVDEEVRVEGGTKVVRTPVLDSKGKVIGYTVTTYNTDGSVASTTFESAGGFEEEDEGIKDSTRDAFAELTNLFTSYGLESLAGEISGYMTEGLTASEALIKLKTNPNGAYAKRFAGNFTRVKNGLNAISEAAYIGLENSYAETLKAYGLGNMINVNRDENYKTFANYIANDMSAVEFKDRISTVVTRVQNSDPGIKATLKSFYPAITDSDLISYFLNPTENLLKLQEKVTASEIGAAAIGAGAGITTNVATATDLAKFGIDQKAAREGYSTIAGILPTSTKLSDIYNQSGIRYAQAEGEAEVFKGSQDAALKRTRLASMERGSFSGSAGRLQTQSKNAGLI